MVKEINYTLLLIAGAFLLNACDSKETDHAVAGDSNTVTTSPTKDEMPSTKSTMALTKIEFTESSFNFGNIDEGKKVDHIFKFKNTGSNPLVLQDARASCGCTIPEYTKDTIAPGQEGKIKVIYDSAGKKGQIDKTVTVTANTDPDKTDIKISAFVVEKKAGPYKQ